MNKAGQKISTLPIRFNPSEDKEYHTNVENSSTVRICLASHTRGQKSAALTSLYQSKARIIDLRQCPSVLRMGGETDSDGFGRTVFDLYFFDGCGC